MVKQSSDQSVTIHRLIVIDNKHNDDHEAALRELDLRRTLRQRGAVVVSQYTIEPIES